jgi:transcriptional regulator of acetoin/glycerol metabolism
MRNCSNTDKQERPPDCEGYDTVPLPEIAGLLVRGGVIEVVGENRTLRVDDERRLIGRAPGCTLVLSDKTVSKVHAEVQATPTGVRLVDLESSNGTFLGPTEMRVEKVHLTEACDFRCGSKRLRFYPAEPERIPRERVERLGGLVGATPEMLALFATLRRYADSTLSILIRGETGTGKERVARAIHEASSRRKEPFEALNCAAVPDALLEAELFGAVAGAYTGAHATRDGRFVEADGEHSFSTKWRR